MKCIDVKRSLFRVLLPCVEFSGICTSYLISGSFLKRILIFRNYFYTAWCKRQFYKCGTNLYISYPIFLCNSSCISIGNNFKSEKGLRLEVITSKHTKKEIIKIGNNVYINWNCHIGGYKKIIIEDNVLIGSNVLITDHFHGEISLKMLAISPMNRPIYSKGGVVIRQNVWIGENVTILPGVTIGKNSIIGANSVVTKSIPENCIVAGNPAKIIRQL